jgi:hypothetical protein
LEWNQLAEFLKPVAKSPASAEPAAKPEYSVYHLLENWLRRARECQYGHYAAAGALARRNYWLGIPVVILTGIVGTSVFATLQHEVDIRLKIATGLVSVLATVLASLQTFLRVSERAEKHRASGAIYGALAREIEQELNAPGAPQKQREFLDNLRSRMDALAKEAPEIPGYVWKTRPYKGAVDVEPAGSNH